MFTASYVQSQVDAMKARNTAKAGIIRATAELRLGWQYVYASQGQDCTPEWRMSRIPYCPSQKYVDMINNGCPVLSGKQPLCDCCAYVDTDVFDCAGFVLNEMQLAGVPFYGQGASTQWNTPSNWAARGEIKTMPKDLVCVVYKRKDDKMSHAGMSMGDGGGGVIHCSTTVKRGNAYTDNPKWTHWGIPKGLYSTEELRKVGVDVNENDNVPTLRRGNTGTLVEKLQKILKETTDQTLKVDGIFGAKTENAVEEFQRKNGLATDGIVGKKTWEKLSSYGVDADEPEHHAADESATFGSIDDGPNKTFNNLRNNVLHELNCLKEHIAEIEKQVNYLFNLI